MFEGVPYYQRRTSSDVGETRPPPKYDAVISREGDRRRDILFHIH